jgi:hypothetical protein
MRLPIALLALTGFASAQHRECFPSGRSWGGQELKAAGLIQQWCDTAGDRTYAAWQSKTTCLNLGGGTRMDLRMGNRGTGGLYISKSQCIGNLRFFVEFCPYGGKTIIGEWDVKYVSRHIEDLMHSCLGFH